MNYRDLSYKQTIVKLYSKLSEITVSQNSILILDRALLKHRPVKSFTKKFEMIYSVQAGESLKDFSKLPSHLNNILGITKKTVKKDLTVYSLGGGSTSDFAGFVASIIHRGVSVIHIPSTWIAAVDSAHGGKTAMNLLGYKNQIGTFWYASRVLLCRDLLMTQDEQLFKDSFGELLKVAFLENENLFQKICKVKKSKEIFPLLTKLVNAKYKVLQKDPFEKKGYRKILNLGHTVGHAYEAKFKIPHGKAVLLGMHFAIWLSQHLDFMAKDYGYKTTEKLNRYINKDELLFFSNSLKQSLIDYILFDKKMNTKNKVSFVLVKKAGTAFYKDVKLNELDRYFKLYHQQLISHELFL